MYVREKFFAERLMGILFFIVVILGVMLTAILISGCQHKVALIPRPACNWKLWAGDSADSSVTRAQDGKSVKCSDPAFDSYICLTRADLSNLLTCGASQ
jgi:hypothetical protein